MSTFPKTINTEVVSENLRKRAINLDTKRILLTKFTATEQEQDLTKPPNCDGFGRIHHFRRNKSSKWPCNPLPIDPACKKLGLERTHLLRAQVFQNAACNWRCWYCFVPFKLLAADLKYSAWMSVDELLDLYQAEEDRPVMIDLTGGQPDLVPEWVPWMMNALTERGLAESVYLWSDDNLSNDYFWQYLTEADRKTITNYRNYGRVSCFKGFNPESFTFNTLAAPDLFEQQFALMGRLLKLGVDQYAYATFTTPSSQDIADDMRRFVDKLQALDRNLPLRTVPLEIQQYTPMESRIRSVHEEAIQYQYLAIEAWQRELESRFTDEERMVNISDVSLGGN